jgi:hypothetical protein
MPRANPRLTVERITRSRFISLLVLYVRLLSFYVSMAILSVRNLNSNSICTDARISYAKIVDSENLHIHCETFFRYTDKSHSGAQMHLSHTGSNAG